MPTPYLGLSFMATEDATEVIIVAANGSGIQAAP